MPTPTARRLQLVVQLHGRKQSPRRGGHSRRSVSSPMSSSRRTVRLTCPTVPSARQTRGPRARSPRSSHPARPAQRTPDHRGSAAGRSAVGAAHPAGRSDSSSPADAVEQHRADGTEQTGQHGTGQDRRPVRRTCSRTALPPDEPDPHLRRHLGRGGRIRDDATVHDDPTFTDVAEGSLLRDPGLHEPVQDGPFLGIHSTSRRSHRQPPPRLSSQRRELNNCRIYHETNVLSANSENILRFDDYAVSVRTTATGQERSLTDPGSIPTNWPCPRHPTTTSWPARPSRAGCGPADHGGRAAQRVCPGTCPSRRSSAGSRHAFLGLHAVIVQAGSDRSYTMSDQVCRAISDTFLAAAASNANPIAASLAGTGSAAASDGFRSAPRTRTNGHAAWAARPMATDPTSSAST